MDSKGRISIPISLRARLRMIEGTEVKIFLGKDKGKLFVSPAQEPSRKNSKNNKRSIGVLGGMGPGASADIYAKMIDFCQKKYGAELDADYPRIVINSIPAPQMVDGSLKDSRKLFRALTAGVKSLESSGADFIIMSCNTVHYFFDRLRRQVAVPMLSIIEETAKEVDRSKIKRVGVLATTTTVKQRLYEKELEKFGIKTILPRKAAQDEVTKIIKRIVAGKKSRIDKEKLNDIINGLKRRGAEGVILGCTDLPIIVRKNNFDIEIFDSTGILAEAAVDKSYSE